MTRVETTIKTADGQTIILSPADKITREITLECASNRCASRHGQDKPAEVTLLDGEPMPEAGDLWMTLILPERSPQYSPQPPNFCSGQCVKDFLTYFYQLPSPRNPSPPAIVASAENVQSPEQTKGTASVEDRIAYHNREAILTSSHEASQWHREQARELGESSATCHHPWPEPVAQADGYASDPGDKHQEGENPTGPRFL